MNTLVIFSPRTGSTILNELLAFQHENVDLDEFLSHCIRLGTRGILVNNIPVSILDELRRLNVRYKGFTPHKTNFLSKINLSGYNWSAKCYASNIDTVRYIIETVGNSDTKILFTRRNNLKQQCWSAIMAEAREDELRDSISSSYSSHIHTNKHKYPEIKQKQLDIKKAAKTIKTTILSANIVKQLHEEFGGTMMTYEETISINDFSLSGITPETTQKYNELELQMIKPDYIPPEKYFHNYDEIDALIEQTLKQHP